MSENSTVSGSAGGSPVLPAKPAFTPGPSTLGVPPSGGAEIQIPPKGGTPNTPNVPSGLVDAAAQVTAAPSPAAPPRPSFLPKIPMPAPAPGRPPQPGWWKVGGIKGAKADVARAVGQISGIPGHWQEALQKEIAAHDAPAVSVSAHFMQENRKGAGGKGKMVLHLDISPIDGFVGQG